MSSNTATEESSYITKAEFQKRYSADRRHYEITNPVIVKKLTALISKNRSLYAEMDKKKEELFGIMRVGSVEGGIAVFALSDEEKQKPDFAKRWRECNVVIRGQQGFCIFHRPSDSEEGKILSNQIQTFYGEFQEQIHDLSAKKNKLLTFDKDIVIHSPSRSLPVSIPLNPELELIGEHVILSVDNVHKLRYVIDPVTHLCLRSDIVCKAIDAFDEKFRASTENLKLKSVTPEDYAALEEKAKEDINNQFLDNLLFGGSESPQVKRERKQKYPSPRI